MIDTQKLRQRILDLAIRGKLVPQDPNDEPASVLLERIRAEKERLISEGKIKRPKKSKSSSSESHYQNFTPPFDIPDTWEWVRLEELTSKIGSGSTPKGSNYSESGIPFFRSQNIYNHGLVYDDIKYISQSINESMQGTVVHANDLLLNITGGSIGRCAVVPSSFEIGNVSQHVCIIRPLLINSDYIPHYPKLPDNWALTTLEEIIDYQQPQAYIVKSTDYSEEFSVPVLTAGKSFILGYTNEVDSIYTDVPVIIFDDFTTDSHYVDFPFKVKSSAMKILSVKFGINIEYVAYYMSITRLNGDTHRRYWISEYSKLAIPLPPKGEQDRIVREIKAMYLILDEIAATLS